jgi:hypothetical protein
VIDSQYIVSKVLRNTKSGFKNEGFLYPKRKAAEAAFSSNVNCHFLLPVRIFSFSVVKLLTPSSTERCSVCRITAIAVTILSFQGSIRLDNKIHDSYSSALPPRSVQPISRSSAVECAVASRVSAVNLITILLKGNITPFARVPVA